MFFRYRLQCFLHLGNVARKFLNYWQVYRRLAKSQSIPDSEAILERLLRVCHLLRFLQKEGIQRCRLGNFRSCISQYQCLSVLKNPRRAGIPSPQSHTTYILPQGIFREFGVASSALLRASLGLSYLRGRMPVANIPRWNFCNPELNEYRRMRFRYFDNLRGRFPVVMGQSIGGGLANWEEVRASTGTLDK